MDLLELGSWALLIVILFASLVYLYGTWTYDYWKKRGIPYVKPVPLVGNTFDVVLTKRTQNDIYKELYKELEGYPYGGLFQFREPTLLIRDPELIKSVLVKDFHSFHDNAIKIDVNVDPIFGRNPFFLSGERKVYMRKVVHCGHMLRSTISLKKNVNIRFTNMDIMAQAVTFFTDGFETSSVAFSFCLYELAMHPDVQKKLRLEVEDALKKHNGQLTFEAVQGMTYLDMALSESLRLHPPLTVMMKLCTKPFDLETPSGGKYTVEVGTPVHIPCEAIHYDAKYFPDPEKFDPERFSEENKNSINKYTYLPFGEGPRVCLGFRFGLMQVKAGIAYLVHHFEIRPTCKTPNPLVLDPSYFLPVAKGGLWLDFVKRKSTS